MKRWWKHWLVIAGFVFVVILTSTQCATFRPRNFEIKKDLVFKKGEGFELKGDIYEPRGAGLHPGVIVVHGGGWTRRQGDMTGICRDLANAGFVAFNITYRLSPKNHYPAPAEDVRSAIDWFKSHAQEYQVDPERLAGWGYSAGSHLLLLAAIDGSAGLKAIVVGAAPTDLTPWSGSSLIRDFIGAEEKDKPELWKAASPVFHVTEKSPPLFMYHGGADWLVWPHQMEEMAEAMRAKNRPVETHLDPYKGHFTVYLFGQKWVDMGVKYLSDRLITAQPTK